MENQLHLLAVSKEFKEMIENSQETSAVESFGASDVVSKSYSAGLLKDIFVKCRRCRKLLYVREWEKNLKVCEICSYHFLLSAYERISFLLDRNSFVETETEMQFSDPLNFAEQ